MHLIKLSATPSTNNFLKQLSVNHPVSDFTVVWADVQTNGKGQMGASWVTQGANNLTFSVYVSEKYLLIEHLFTLNIMVANAVLKALYFFNLTDIWVKWPNDILAVNKKIAGILIENTIKSSGSFSAIVGIGINLNQTDFEGFPQASSVLNQFGIVINKEALLQKIVAFLKEAILNAANISEKEWRFYHEHLFRKDMVSTFENKVGGLFNGIIKEVNRHGQLVVQLENDDLMCYNLKEVKMLY